MEVQWFSYIEFCPYDLKTFEIDSNIQYPRVFQTLSES